MQADLEKMGMGLNKLAQEDPSFGYSRDPETNQTVIQGMGELHLEIIVDRLRREFKVESNVGKPEVAYREGISKMSDVSDGLARTQHAWGSVSCEVECLI